MALQDATNALQGVSGPGKFAKRTDLEYQSPEYGAGAAMAQQMQGAPLASSPDIKGTAPSILRRDIERGAAAAPVAAQGEVTPLFAPSQRPNEPITHGVDIGPGAGANVLMMRKNEQKLSDALAKMLPYDTTGEIAILYQDALSRGN